jgi:hypothetical protein
MLYRQNKHENLSTYFENFTNLLEAIKQFWGSVGTDHGLVLNELKRSKIIITKEHKASHPVYDVHKSKA